MGTLIEMHIETHHGRSLPFTSLHRAQLGWNRNCHILVTACTVARSWQDSQASRIKTAVGMQAYFIKIQDIRHIIIVYVNLKKIIKVINFLMKICKQFQSD
jgi:hypothetical protein